MKNGRWFLHPIFGNKRSFSIFVINMLAVGTTMSVLWNVFVASMKDANISLYQLSGGWMAIALSPVTHFAIAAAAVTLGAGFIATKVLGPIQRMEQWLKDWDGSRDIPMLELREEDGIYENIAHMINRLREKSQSKKKPKE